MKLIFENFRKFLNEQQEEGMLLYHATCSPPESFINGIDATIAKGFGQGAGFYLFTKKQHALSHGKKLVNDPQGQKKEVSVDCKDGGFIIVVDEPVTPENFDIDYEIFSNGFAQFIDQNIDYFSENDQALGLGRRAGKGVTKRPDGNRISINRKLLGIGRGNYTYKLTRAADDFDIGVGKVFSLIAKRLHKLNPEMFKKFEEQFLSKAIAIKYNGEEKLIPLRIEDLEGNVVWSRG